MKIHRLVCCIILAFAFTGCARDGILDISRGWRYSQADDPAAARPYTDVSDWKTTDLPSPVFKSLNPDFVWLRTSVTIPPALKDRDIAIYLGKIDAGDETYCNGSIIGKSGRYDRDYFSTWNFDRYWLWSA